MVTGIKNVGRSHEDKYDDQIAEFVQQEYERRKSERLPFELQWRLNTEFLNGNQFLDIDPTSVSIQEIPKLYWYQEREVFNQMATIYETRVAQLSRTIPMLKVRPASQEDGDISAARVSSSLLQSTWYDGNMDVIWDDLCAWTELTGTALIKNAWNKDRGRTVMIMRVPKEQQENKASNGDTEQASEMLEGEYEEVELKRGRYGRLYCVAIRIFP